MCREGAVRELSVVVTLVGAVRSRVHLHSKQGSVYKTDPFTLDFAFNLRLALVRSSEMLDLFRIKLSPFASFEFFVAAECAFAHLAPKKFCTTQNHLNFSAN